MKIQFLFMTLLIGMHTNSLCAFSPYKHSAQKNKDKQKQEEAVDTRFKLTTPMPRNLLSKEKRIASFFSQEIMPIAQGLHAITVGKEADTAREAKIKLRQQRAAQIRRPTSFGRGKQVSVPSSRSSGWGGSSWGSGGGFGGYRPTGGYNWGGGGYRPSYAPSYSPGYSTPSWGTTPSSGSYYRPSSHTPSPSKALDDKEKDDKKYWYSDKSKKKKEKEERKKEKKVQTKAHAEKTLDSLYKTTIAMMQKITHDLASVKEEDKQAVYQNRLKMRELSSLTKNLEKINKTLKPLSTQDQEAFEKKYVTSEHKNIIVAFLPHLIRFLTVPTHNFSSTDQDRCNTEQADAAQKILSHPFITTSTTKDTIKSVANNVQNAIASHYSNQAAQHINQLKAIATKEPPALAPDDQQKQTAAFDGLMPLKEDLLDIRAKFQTYFFDPENINSTLQSYNDAVSISQSFYAKVKKQVDDRYKKIMQEIQNDTTDIQAAVNKKTFIKNYLTLTANARAKNFKDFNTCLTFLHNNDKQDFEKKYLIPDYKAIAFEFLPYCIDFLLYPADATSIDPDIQKLCAAQKSISTWILPLLTAPITDAEFKTKIIDKDKELAQWYSNQAEPYKVIINELTETPANKNQAKTNLGPIHKELEIIIKQKFDATLAPPTKLLELYDEIDGLLTN